MKNIVRIAAVAFFTSAMTVQAAELQSGLQVGDYPGAFYVTDVTGPSAGEALCYRCQYGARPVVTIFARTLDDNVRKLVKQVDEVVAKNYKEQRMAAFMVLLSDEPQKHEKTLVTTAKDAELSHTPLTTYKKAEGPRKYRIHEDAEVTVMMWVDSDVKANHAFTKGQLNDEAIAQVISDTSKILN